MVAILQQLWHLPVVHLCLESWVLLCHLVILAWPPLLCLVTWSVPGPDSLIQLQDSASCLLPPERQCHQRNAPCCQDCHSTDSELKVLIYTSDKSIARSNLPYSNEVLFREFSAHLKDGSCSVQAGLLHCDSNSCCCCRLAFNWRLRCKLLSCCSIRLSLLPEVWLSANLQQPVSLGQGHSDRELLAIDRSYSSCCAGGAEVL